MSRLLRRTLVGVVLGVVLYVAAVLYADASRMAEALHSYAWSAFAIALGLSSINYLLRFAKWELCLRWLDVRRDAPDLGYGRSLVIYLAGLSMSVTPGKVGEVLRSLLLRASDGVPFSRTAPIVVADRLTDLVALVVLSLVGVSQFPEAVPVVVATLALVVAGVVVLGSPKLLRGVLSRLALVPRLGGIATRAELLVDSSATLLRLRPLAWLSVLSVAGWGLECVGYWVVLHGFAGIDAGLGLCTFLWATTTLIGALSFLPGGLGATEGSLGALVVRLAGGVGTTVAVTSTLLIRAATLWWGELVGATALALFLRDPTVRARARDASVENA